MSEPSETGADTTIDVAAFTNSHGSPDVQQQPVKQDLRTVILFGFPYTVKIPETNHSIDEDGKSPETNYSINEDEKSPAQLWWETKTYLYKIVSSELVIEFLLHTVYMGLMSIVALVLGAVYYNSECNNDVALGLIITGATGIMCVFMGFIVKTDPFKDNYNTCRKCSKYCQYFYGLLIFAFVCIVIWGMTLVWPYQTDGCNRAIYIYGFIYWNLWWWVITAFIVVLIIAVILGVIYLGFILCCGCELNCASDDEE